MMNVGTLVSAAIRPNSSLDPIASAFASEIRGGLHTATSSTDRNNIIFERREWGMMCYVINDNQTYQLKYDLQDKNIMNNNNWSVFSGSGGGGGGEWLDSVIAIQSVEPISPNDGDRYIIGQPPIGANWTSLPSNLVVQWNSTLSQWDQTFPTDETSVRVDNEDNAIYNYEGNWPTGQWYKERLGQVRDILLTTTNGADYTGLSNPPFSGYTPDLIFLTKFSGTNISGTVSVNINGLGAVQLKKPSSSGLIDTNPNDIIEDIIYSLTFDGTYFQINRPYKNDDIFSIKYYIEPTDYIVVPQYYQYWVYSDLEIAGNLVNYGHVIISNGSLILSGGTFSNYGSLSFVDFISGGFSASFNNSDTIEFTQSNDFFGLSVSAEVKPNSLLPLNLNTSTYSGPTSGYVLSTTDDGFFEWVPFPSVTLGTQSGLTFSSGDLQVLLDDSTIKINPGGEIFVSGNSVYQTGIPQPSNGNNSPTGITVSSSPLGYSTVKVFVNGQIQVLGTGSTDCYFYDGTGPVQLENISIGDELYWNGLISQWELSSNDLILIIYED
jgi:hypothetical protein